MFQSPVSNHGVACGPGFTLTAQGLSHMPVFAAIQRIFMILSNYRYRKRPACGFRLVYHACGHKRDACSSGEAH